MSHHPTSKLAMMASAAVLVALLGACGGGAESPSSAETAGTEPTQSATSFDDWQLSFADCMRGEGIDMPDPDSGGGLGLDNGGDPNAFAAAAQKCRDELGDPPAADGPDTTTDEQMLADQLKTAKCLREEGYDVADPEPGEGLNVPADVPPDVLETCAPNGIVGPAAP
jgi:hypothetical protein